MKLPIIFEDDDLLIIDKPAGLLTHPANAATHPSVVDFARQHTTDPDPDLPGIVHRLDKDTSGLMIIAKTATAKAWIRQLFKDRKVQKTYIALVAGHPKPPEAIVRLPIGRQLGHGSKRSVSGSGRSSETHYRMIARYDTCSLLELRPKSGRTHQLRVHLSFLGHPIVGDELYGKKVPGLARQFLHASSLDFTGPSGRHIVVSSALPADLESYLAVPGL